MKANSKVVGLLCLVLGVAAGYYMASSDFSSLVSDARAQDAARSPVKKKPSASPVKALKEQDVYYPGSEDLAPDEMRVVACGTGMPNSRPKQAAACFLVELGNGDKFIFDIGSGSRR